MKHTSLEVAFVLKNYIPEKHKVVLLHEKLGKIMCLYSKRHAASRLCTGAQIVCSVEKKQHWYEITHYDILFMPESLSLTRLQFIHEVVAICLRLLPANISVAELFLFLKYVYQHFKQLNQIGQQVILLRLFLLFDLLPESKEIYRYALQDPYQVIKQSDIDINRYVDLCWERFYSEGRH